MEMRGDVGGSVLGMRACVHEGGSVVEEIQ
jgi:hypothetical protein